MIKDRLHEISKYLEKLEERENKAKFNLYMQLPHENLSKIEKERFDYYHEVIGPFINASKNTSEIEDEETMTAIRFLQNNCLKYIYFNQPNSVELVEIIIKNTTNFDFYLEGKKQTRTQVMGILETNSDAKLREAAIRSIITLGEQNENWYLELFRLRKNFMKQLGCSDLYRWFIELNELDKSILDIQEIAKITRNRLEELLYKFHQVNLSDLQVWDLRYFCSTTKTPFNKKIESSQFKHILTTIVKQSGYNLRKMPIYFYNAQIPFDGLCIGTFFKEAKVLFNPRNTLESLSYFFHEFGHAFHTIGNQNNHYLLAAAEPAFFKEGVAYCFENIPLDPLFMQEYLKFKDTEIAFIMNQLNLKRLVDILLTLVNIEFERQVYLLSEIQDTQINQLYSDVYHTIIGIEHSNNTYWASSVSFAKALFFALHYLIAELIMSQTMNAIRNKPEYKNYLNIIPLLDEYYISSSRPIHWNAKIKKLTGQYLSIDFLMRSIQK